MATRILYELAGEDPARRFSPYCWRSHLALAHKGLEVETVPWRFMDGDAIAFSGQGKVPVLVDGDTVVHDSWQIAEYLEKTYPDAPSLFGCAESAPAVRFINAWADSVLIPLISRVVVADIPPLLAPGDREYFRRTREARFGATLEAVCASRDTHIETLRLTLMPMRLTLRAQPFLGGDTPHYADYAVFGAFQWARCVSDYPLLTADDTVLVQWADRLLDAFGGLARQAPGYRIAA